MLASQEAVSSLEKDNVILKEKVAGLQLSLSQASEAKSMAISDREQVETQKISMEAELGSLRGQLSNAEAQLEAGRERETGLKGQIEHLVEVCYSLSAQLQCVNVILILLILLTIISHRFAQLWRVRFQSSRETSTIMRPS